MSDLIGQILLNQFRVDAFIASGGMGAVYRVWDLKRSVPLAMKVLQRDLVDDPSVLKYFQREARALQKLAHPNIVPFYGLYQTDEITFLLEQFVDGPDLRDILRKHSSGMSVSEVMKYMKALCSALGYAHANGVVHCDIKPGNVMINSGGQIYLADFGIARHAQSVTTTIAGSGTPAYMAPEQIRGEQVVPATDVYELGILFFELLTGKRPFRGDEPELQNSGNTPGERIRYAHLNLQPVTPSKLKPNIPPMLSKVILKALSKMPQERYIDAQAFYQAACQAVNLAPELIPARVVLPSTSANQFTPVNPPAPAIKQPSRPGSNYAKYAMIAGGAAVFLLIVFLVAKMGSTSGAAPWSPVVTQDMYPTPNVGIIPAPPTNLPAQEPTSTEVAIDLLPATQPPLEPTAARPPTVDIPSSSGHDFAFVSDRGNPVGEMNAYIANSNNLSDFQMVGIPPGYKGVFWPSFCGSRLAVEAHLDPNSPNNDSQQIYWIDLNNQPSGWSNPPIPDATAKLGVPRCSPDGRYLAYSIPRNSIDLVISDLSNGGIIFDSGSYGSVAGYAYWARDLSFVYMVVQKPPMILHSASIMSQSSQIFLEAGSGTYPALSPDGRLLAFTCNDVSLCVSNRDGTGIRLIQTISWQSNIPYWTPKGVPVWSSDGNWIYFTSWDSQGNDWDIFRIHPDGNGQENVTRDWSSNEFMPATR